MWAEVETEAQASSPAPVQAEGKGAPRPERVNRQQMVWRSIDVEHLIGEDHPARAIWELVRRLDLSAYHQAIAAVEGRAGRPALAPQLLMSLWIYAYSEGVNSAREVAELCEFHPAYPAYAGLTGLQEVNHHPSADGSDFRAG
jgi:transposase